MTPSSKTTDQMIDDDARSSDKSLRRLVRFLVVLDVIALILGFIALGRISATAGRGEQAFCYVLKITEADADRERHLAKTPGAPQSNRQAHLKTADTSDKFSRQLRTIVHCPPRSREPLTP